MNLVIIQKVNKWARIEQWKILEQTKTDGKKGVRSDQIPVEEKANYHVCIIFPTVVPNVEFPVTYTFVTRLMIAVQETNFQ